MRPRVILKSAGGPGNRWLLGRKAQWREESPDTVLRRGERKLARTLDRATRLVTPGDFVRKAKPRIVPQKIKPPAQRSTVASRRETCETSHTARNAGKGEKVG